MSICSVDLCLHLFKISLSLLAMLFVLSTRAALHESQLRIILVYLIVGLGAAPLFILCLTQAALVPLTLQTAGWAPLLGPKLCSVNRVFRPHCTCFWLQFNVIPVFVVRYRNKRQKLLRMKWDFFFFKVVKSFLLCESLLGVLLEALLNLIIEQNNWVCIRS